MPDWFLLIVISCLYFPPELPLLITKPRFTVESLWFPPLVFLRPLFGKDHQMKVVATDRRLTVRHNFRTPICVRLWKSAIPEELGESESERGILFATDSLIPVGTVLEIFLKMPKLITGEPTTEWHCSGHVVRVESTDSRRGKHGVGVQFDCYQVAHGITAQSR
jgi:hypothetical protein